MGAPVADSDTRQRCGNLQTADRWGKQYLFLLSRSIFYLLHILGFDRPHESRDCCYGGRLFQTSEGRSRYLTTHRRLTSKNGDSKATQGVRGSRRGQKRDDHLGRGGVSTD